MRVLRFALLNSYFNSAIKNKKKALLLINIGIFLSIFAVSTAIISFFVERQISIKQSDLLYLQIEDKFYSKLNSEFDTMITFFNSQLQTEENYRVEKEFLANTSFDSRLLSDKDFYGPYIYSNLIVLKRIVEDPEWDVMTNINSQEIKEILDDIYKVWPQEDAEEFKSSIVNLKDTTDKLLKINSDNYKFDKIPNLKDISLEIINYQTNNVYNVNEKILDDYSTAIDFSYALLNWSEQMLLFVSAKKEYGEENIKLLNKEIITLSRNERNFIFGTFIFQFFIFIIIQVFEINSINQNFRKRNI